MRRADVTTQNSKGDYKSYSITFKNEGHFNAWYDKVIRFRGKVIGVEFEDGKCEDGWIVDDDPHDALICDQRWNKIKGY